MKKYSVLKKNIVIGICLLFIVTAIFPSSISEKSHGKKIITVDNEPGDTDYTSIMEAINHSNPGDTIEVFSGTYNESNITITIPNLTLMGIPYELGTGNDTGKPFVMSTGYDYLFTLYFSDGITITGCIIEQKGNPGGGFPLITLDHVRGGIISNNEFRNSSEGIYSEYSTDIQIVNNTFDMAGVGIELLDGKNTVSGNVITDTNIGMYIKVTYANIITKNWISRCTTALEITDSYNNLISLNHLENNSQAIYIDFSGNNTFQQNNFIQNADTVYSFNTKTILFQKWSTVLNKWIENFWDDWNGIGPKMIVGQLYLYLPGLLYWLYLDLEINCIQFDWHPAKEPYTIP